MKPQALVWMGGASLLGLLLLSNRRRVEGIVSDVEDWFKQVVDRTSRHEGSYSSLNLNTDNAGLSFGRLQWSQRTGALGTLLRAMHKASPERFAAVFGPSWQALLTTTEAANPQARLAPVGGVVLWAEPWAGRFRQAGREPLWQQVQDQMAFQGPHAQGALQSAKILGLTTQRSIAITYDTAVQQGPGAARDTARRAVASLQGRTVSQVYLLEKYIQLAASPFTRTTDPGAHKNPNLEWRVVGGAWHLFAGKVDLYLDVLRRRTSLLKDPALSDEPVVV